ncbi:MAG: hypothetical protein M1828_000666 [Chrysothrix sp. TS-e1954]|nr:MAG: hypothetical protein M1828_000666 [Chrysothrix sp. TS-e1954]
MEQSSPQLWTEDARYADWARNALEMFKRAEGDEKAPTFGEYLQRMYAPDLAVQTMSCKVTGWCSPISCKEFQGPRETNMTDFDRNAAWILMTSLSNLNLYYTNLGVAAERAARNVGDQQKILVEKYTYVHEEKDQLQHRNQMTNVAIHSCLTAGLIAGGSIGFMAPPAGAVGGTVGGAYAGGLALLSDFMQLDWSNLIENGEINLEGTLALVSTQLHDRIQKVGQVLINGDSVDYDGEKINVITVLEKGQFALPNIATPDELQKRFFKSWMAAVINSSWRYSRAYIIDADVLEGETCESDPRSRWDVKICLKAYPKKLYQLATIDRSHEKDKFRWTHKIWWPLDILHTYPQVRVAPGYKTLESVANITLKEVMTSSLSYYEKFKHRNITSLSVKDIESLNQGPAGIQGVSAGVFDIPVCRSPKGAWLTEYSSDQMRNYPCMCGSPTDSETREFAQAADLAKSDAWKGLCNVNKVFAPNHHHYYTDNGRIDGGPL